LPPDVSYPFLGADSNVVMVVRELLDGSTVVERVIVLPCGVVVTEVVVLPTVREVVV
jgi:hypothetical protein